MLYSEQHSGRQLVTVDIKNTLKEVKMKAKAHKKAVEENESDNVIKRKGRNE